MLIKVPKVQIKNKNKFKTKIDENGRECTSCGVYKLWIDFKGHSRSLTKHSSKCKGCYKLGRRSKGRKKELYSASKRTHYLKTHEPFLWKSRVLRSSLLSRSTKEEKHLVPTQKELQHWLENNPLKCYYSGVPLSIYDLTIDHKIPTSRGGSNQLENLCFCSHHMNSAKGTLTEKEFKDLLEIIKHWDDKGDRILKRLKIGRF